VLGEAEPSVARPVGDSDGSRLAGLAIAWGGAVLVLAGIAAWTSGPRLGLSVLAAALVSAAIVGTALRRVLAQLKTTVEEREKLRRAGSAARDASELKIRTSQERTAVLIDALPDVLVRLSRGGIIADVRNGDTNSIGARIARELGQPIDGILSISSPTTVSEAIAATLDKQGIAKVSAELGLSDGHRRVEIRVVRTSDDECLGLVRDITQDHEVEARLRVAERLASLGTLAGGVAHEINNPLSYVIANVDYVVDALERLPSEHIDPIGGQDVVQALQEIREGGRRIGSIVASLKNQARQEDMPASPADVNDAVESALRILDNQLRYKTGVALALGRIPLAIVNPQRLVQVVVNLLANALDAFPDRSSDQNLVRVGTRVTDDGDAVVLEVTDNGVGMLPDVRNRIFDPFFTTKAPGVGTGLGLYLSHQYVDAVGGTIDVESHPGKGTTFRVRFLAVEGSRDDEVEPMTTPLAPSRILIVDDEPLVARSLARMLRGHELVLASDGEAALWECLSRDFDLILCDVMMPRMDGSAFFAALKEHRPRLAARIVFMTGGAFTTETRAFLDAVPNAWVEKPIVLHRLFDAARRQLAAAELDSSARASA
jgi:signal transduction histidine kinase/CheY-like chemotaxis protein